VKRHITRDVDTTLPPVAPGGFLRLNFRDQTYWPNPIVPAYEYFVYIGFDEKGRVNVVQVSHHRDRFGMFRS
jgi:hypothetical protein